MSENSTIIDQIRKTADLALKSTTIHEGIRHLARAFSLFSKETARLKKSYRVLEQEYERSREEMHRVLSQKVQKLNALSFFLNNILKKITQGILFIDLSGVVTIMNEEAERILKRDAKQLLFKRFWNFFPDDFFRFSMRDALNFGLCQKASYVPFDSKEIEISTTFVFEGPKASHGMILILRDITQVQKLQILVNRNERMKDLGQMATTVAHEIRNPLGGIRGYATLLHRELEKNPELQQMSQAIIDGTKNLDRLVARVLHYARDVDIEPKQMDLVLFLRKVCKFIKTDPSFPKNVRLQVHLPIESFRIPLDEESMRRALLNLMVNAFQAMPQGGNLSLSLIKNDPIALISISDTGTGIEKKNIEKIFSPFFTTKQKGNGLGLSEAHKIIRAHHGTLEVRSSMGKGTTFTIMLPLRRGTL